MDLNLTESQIEQIESMGINIPSPKPKRSIYPLLSISGLTVLSLGGLFLLKNRQSTPPAQPITPIRSPQGVGGPTQVPKSIQHYLLTSQQQFTEALQYQQSNTTKAVDLINQSILAATEATKLFPNDYRSYEQRARIYQSLIDSQPQFLSSAINDFSTAAKLNPNSAEITRSLATLFARQGDAKSTLVMLAQTVTLEPTKAQNFYDLARLQQQTGLLPQALETYNRLLPLISDPNQKQQVISEKTAIESLLTQNIHPSEASAKEGSPTPKTTSPTITLPDSPALIQADSGTGLIIAAPDTRPDLTVTNLTDTNALSGTGILPANTRDITLTNTNLVSTSQVYLTITKGGKNQSLQVLSKSPDSFVVGLDSPINEAIEFKWWIIN